MSIKKILFLKRDIELAKNSLRFFKCGKGGYGEGDCFLGIRVPECRKIAKQFFGLSLLELEKYLKDKYNWVDFNPELAEPVNFHGQTFTNPRSPQMPFHQLAVALCRNNFSLPTLAILDEQMNLLDAVP